MIKIKTSYTSNMTLGSGTGIKKNVGRVNPNILIITKDNDLVQE